VTPAAGGVIRYFVTQDSVGGHTFSVTDGQTTVVLPVPTVPGAGSALALYSPDGTNLFVGS
jgi:hypothetical protein